MGNGAAGEAEISATNRTAGFGARGPFCVHVGIKVIVGMDWAAVEEEAVRITQDRWWGNFWE